MPVVKNREWDMAMELRSQLNRPRMCITEILRFQKTPFEARDHEIVHYLPINKIYVAIKKGNPRPGSGE
jgi:hypothetical protein